jgi:hypothetical protein
LALQVRVAPGVPVPDTIERVTLVPLSDRTRLPLASWTWTIGWPFSVVGSKGNGVPAAESLGCWMKASLVGGPEMLKRSNVRLAQGRAAGCRQTVTGSGGRPT